MGTSTSTIVYPLLVLALTNSPTAAGFQAALGSIPYIVFSLPVGALIDRWDRKRVMIICDIGRALTLASIPLAMLFDVLTLWQLYLASLVEGSLFVFSNIAEVAALPRVVEKAQRPEASAQNEAAFGIAGIVGPTFGTWLYGNLRRGIPLVADAISYVVSVASLALILTFSTNFVYYQLSDDYRLNTFSEAKKLSAHGSSESLPRTASGARNP